MSPTLLVNLLLLKSNFVLIMGFLNSDSFIIKSNDTKLYALSRTYNDYSFLYRRYLPFLIY